MAPFNKLKSIVRTFGLNIMVDIVVPLSFFAAIFGIVYVVVTAQHKEKMAMLEKGILQAPELKEKKSGYNLWLKFSCTILGIGWGLTDGFNYHMEYVRATGNPMPITARVVLYAALGMIAAYIIDRIENYISEKNRMKKDNTSGREFNKPTSIQKKE